MTSNELETQSGFFPREFWVAILINFVWINVSEVIRYFVFVMPMMREAFVFVPDIAPMNFPVFLIWGVWDTILVFSATFFSWMIIEKYTPSVRTAVLAGTIVWFTVFVILWLGLYNMSLATLPILAIALPLAWIEMIVAALIVRRCFLKQ